MAGLQKWIPNYAYISTEGITGGAADISDHTHFNAASARLPRQRYAAAMQPLQRKAHRRK